MKSTSTLLVLVLTFFSALSRSSGQNYLNKRYDNLSGIVSALKNNEGYLLLATEISSKGNRMALLQINEKGDTLWKASDGLAGKDYQPVNLLDNGPDGYIITGTIFNDPKNHYRPDDIFICKYKSGFQGLNIIHIKDSLTGLGQSTLDKDGNILLTGTTQNYGTGWPVLFCALWDKKADVFLWKRVYDTIKLRSTVNCIDRQNNAWLLSISGLEPIGGNGTLVKIDMNGKLIWAQTHYLISKSPGDYSEGIWNTVSLSGNRSLFVGTSYSSDSLYFACIDSNGTEKWKKRYPLKRKYIISKQIISFGDSTYCLIGDSSYNGSKGLALRFNAKGDTLGSRYLSYGPDKVNSLNGFVPYKKHGFLLYGYTSAFNYPHRNDKGWIVTIDSLLKDSLIQTNNLCDSFLYVKHFQYNKYKTAFCNGDSTSLSVSPSGYIYNWSNGKKGDSLNVKKAGSYNVVISDTNGCSQKMDSVKIAIKYLPTPVIKKQGDSLLSNYPDSNQWLFNGIEITGATKQSYKYVKIAGAITLRVKNECGSAVSAPFIVTGVNSLTPDTEIRIFPNPLSDCESGCTLNIECRTEIESISVFNVLGMQILFTSEIHGTSASINVPRNVGGIYFVKVKMRSSEVLKRILIRE